MSTSGTSMTLRTRKKRPEMDTADQDLARRTPCILYFILTYPTSLDSSQKAAQGNREGPGIRESEDYTGTASSYKDQSQSRGALCSTIRFAVKS